MSRSFKKYPLVCPSKKYDKQISSRIVRHKAKQVMNGLVISLIWQDQGGFHEGSRRIGCPVDANLIDTEDFHIPTSREAYDLWWVGQGDYACNFEPEKYPELMRK